VRVQFSVVIHKQGCIYLRKKTPPWVGRINRGKCQLRYQKGEEKKGGNVKEKEKRKGKIEVRVI
jgi:hypothetical protein